MVEIVQRAKVAMKVFRSEAITGKVKARILITGSVTDAEAVLKAKAFCKRALRGFGDLGGLPDLGAKPSAGGVRHGSVRKGAMAAKESRVVQKESGAVGTQAVCLLFRGALLSGHAARPAFCTDLAEHGPLRERMALSYELQVLARRRMSTQKRSNWRSSP